MSIGLALYLAVTLWLGMSVPSDKLRMWRDRAAADGLSVGFVYAVVLFACFAWPLSLVVSLLGRTGGHDRP